MPRGVPKAGFRRTKNHPNGPVTITKFNPEPAPIVESRFSINERFGFVSDMVTMLALGDQASVIVTGPGGLGKSFTVTQALRQSGLQDVSLTEDFEVGETIGKNAYRVIKGYSTPKGLYRTLYENRNGVIVFDDCDSVLKDPVSLNLLKGALDSYSRRIISWRADLRDDDLPTTFEFKGRVIFISNLSSNQIDQAIITRSMAVDLSMTPQQKIERMKFILDSEEFMPEYPRAMKLDALNLIDSLRNRVKELSLRTLIQVAKIRKANPNGNWKSLAEYTICG
ncbi:MAG: hypothetical protein EBU90_23085 [Proteobacteria bacterium]|nr:hypothetical protein [Pseudomonadota bacterium]